MTPKLCRIQLLSLQWTNSFRGSQREIEGSYSQKAVMSKPGRLLHGVWHTSANTILRKHIWFRYVFNVGMSTKVCIQTSRYKHKVRCPMRVHHSEVLNPCFWSKSLSFFLISKDRNVMAGARFSSLRPICWMCTASGPYNYRALNMNRKFLSQRERKHVRLLSVTFSGQPTSQQGVCLDWDPRRHMLA